VFHSHIARAVLVSTRDNDNEILLILVEKNLKTQRSSFRCVHFHCLTLLDPLKKKKKLRER